MKINVLDINVANKIAAGEVVERPASIVKELVENAIDGGATLITVKILGGGIEEIKVIDNGSGITPAEMPIAFLRHATSKITSALDLNNIGTLGFRGEALPSIASVSKVQMLSREASSIAGYEINVAGSDVIRNGEIGMSVGTTVVVRDLFYNTPARRKFLKSESTENAYIATILAKLALSQPQIAFTYINNNREIFKTTGDGKFSSPILGIYGGSYLADLTAIDGLADFEIEGYISLPPASRSNKKHYNIFLNGRAIESKEVVEAIDEVYATLLPHGRYPMAFIYLTIDLDRVDVNVHPNKIQVRFDSDLALKENIKEVLNYSLIPKVIEDEPEVLVEEAIVGIQEVENTVKTLPFDYKRMEARESQAVYGAMDLESYAMNYTTPNLKEDDIIEFPVYTEINPIQEILEETVEDVNDENIYNNLLPMGQLGGDYIIATLGRDLYLIDQHAAHERINYEKFARYFREKGSEAIMLLIPYQLELSTLEREILLNHILELTEIGFIVEHFGDNTFLLRSLPAWYYGEESGDELFRSILDMATEKGIDYKAIADYEVFTKACKSSVKANTYLTTADINWLLGTLANTPNALTCPHGRPIMIKMTDKEIRNRFMRS